MGRDSQQHRTTDSGDRYAGATGHSYESAQDEWIEAKVRQILSRVGFMSMSPVLEIRVDELMQAAGDGERGRSVLMRMLVQALRKDVAQAWTGGWEPVDLDRFAGRRYAAAEQKILRDAMVDELGGYASATVDPLWPAQLQELEARVWWAPERSYLQQRARVSWMQTLASAVRVLCLLRGLRPIQQFSARPGTYVANARDAKKIDERILSRVRALLAKAESTTFEAEAETFTAGAQALMARHSIDAALLSATEQQDPSAPEGRRIGIDAPYEAPKFLLLAEIAGANRCRTAWSKGLGFVTVLGFAADLDAVETLFTSLLVQATSAVSREGSRKGYYGQSRTRSFRRSFLSSFAQRIGERLREVTEQETKAAEAAQRLDHSDASFDTDRLDSSHGKALMPLLAARSQQVDEALTRMFPSLQTQSFGGGSDPEGWESGRRAADQAVLNRGAAVERGRSARTCAESRVRWCAREMNQAAAATRLTQRC